MWYNVLINMFLSPKSKIPYFLAIIAIYPFLLVQSAGAFSLKDMLFNLADALGIVSAEGNQRRDVRETNIQNMQVFEAEKNLRAASVDQESPKIILDNEDLSLEVGKENFYSGESVENSEENVLHNANAIYKVRRGETISSIASYFGISSETILSYNKIALKDVREDIILEIPPTSGINYEVKKGDTLEKLAKKYNLNIDDLTLTTGYSADEALEVGEEVFLAGAKDEKKPAEKPKAKTKTAVKNRNADIASLGDLAKYARNLGRGSTAQFNKISDIRKYFNLPRYAGYYTHPAPGTRRTQTMHGHNGSDFAGKIGTPVIASAAGVIKVAKDSGYNFGYGNYIIVKHSNGTETVYAHLSSVNVSAGQNVAQGEMIGRLGSSGNSTGPHLHFEIRGAYNQWAW